jgi:flagellar hook-associated protein 2
MSTSISATGSISSAGLGSGLDVNSIVSGLMAVESQPLTLLQNTATSLTTQVSAFGQLQSLTSGMRDAAYALTSLSLWNQTTSSSSDASTVGVSTTGGAAVGNYNVSVQNLASGQTVSSSAFSSATAAVGQGTLTVELGSWGSDGTSFTPKSGGSPVSITIGPGDTSLTSIRDKINAAGAGVTATIVNDASGARLAIRSSSTGAVNAFRITGSETAGDGNTGAGLSALTYDPSGSATTMSLNQTAVNANATINGIAVSSASNTLDGVADGLTLTLLKTTTAGSSISVGVSADADAVTAGVTKFVSAFNSLASYIQTNTKYDATSKTGGVLQGDGTVNSIESQLRAIINQPNTTGGQYTVLSDVGISMQADGTLAVDSTKLANAVANRSDLKKLFQPFGSTTATTGFMMRFSNLGDALLNSDGAIPTRNTSLQTMLKQNSDSQSAMQTRLDQTQARLLAQYQALDTSMAQLNSTSSYLTQQLAAMNKTA